MSNKLFRDTLLASTMIAGMAFIASPALAQDVNADSQTTDVQTAPAEALPVEQAAPGDEIIVTGTLIRNPNIEASSPVTVVGEEEIELQQSNVAEELLRELPGVVPSIGSAVNNGNGGSSYVNLRGLGSNRNLVLLDGTRIVPADLQGRVDLNNIPLALVERVDVLTGGASTTYGADAVTGVVNFITKDDFAGMELGLSEQITELGDGNTFRADLTVGANFDDGRGNATFSVGYQESDPVYQGARDFSRVAIFSEDGSEGGSGTATPSRLFLPGLATRQIGANGDLVAPYSFFNYNPFNIFQTPFERFNIFGTANYEVADGIQVYNRGLFSKQTVSTIIAPSGSFGNSFTVGIGNPFLDNASVRNAVCASIDTDPVTAGIQSPTQAQCDAAALTTDPDDPNFLEQTFAVSRRFVEGGPRFTNYTTQVFDYKIGVRGDITDSLGFDVFGAYGESENQGNSTGQGLYSRLTQAVDAVRAPDGSIVCRDASGGCIPFDLFGPTGSIDPAAFGFINVTTTGSTITSLAQVRGVVSGDFGLTSPLATEAIGIAVGAEYRDYFAGSSSDLATQTPGEVLGSGGSSPDVAGRYDVYEAFAELIVPLISDRPFFHDLTLELGGRVSDYSTAGTNYTYKAGGSWTPVPAIKIRGNYNRAARSPNISELFFPVTTGLGSLAIDPCAGTAPVGNAALTAICIAQGAPAGTIGLIAQPSAGQVNVTGGGNPTLDVEKATTWTIGAVFQPDFIPGFTATIDYYDIEIEDAITSPSEDDVINLCFNVDPANALCDGIQRNPLTGGLDGSAATTPGLPQPLSNLGTLQTNGIDVSLNYRRDLGFAGLNLSFNGNWTDSLEFQANPAAINRECVGLYSASCGPVGPAGSINPELSFNQRTTLSFDNTDVSLLWRYIDGVEFEGGADGDVDDDGSPEFLPEFSSIDAYHYFDLSLRQEVMDNFTFTFTVQNLFDKKPPIVGASIGSTTFNSGNTYPSTYDALGRRYAVGATLRF